MANMAMCVKRDDDPWKNIIGLASACIATLGRIGWDVPQMGGWKTWIDREGRQIDPTQISPYSFKKLLHRDIAKQYWTTSMFNELAKDNTGVWLQPLRAAVFSDDREKGAMTRSAAIGTQWTQSSVAQAGYASSKEDDKCRLCESATGTLEHRFSCPTTCPIGGWRPRRLLAPAERWTCSLTRDAGT